MPSDTNTHERTEGAAAAVQAKHGDSCSANRVDLDPMCLTTSGDYSTGPPTLPCSRDDALVGNGATVPKSCLPPLAMRTPSAAGGLLPAGITSTVTRITFDQPPLWFCPTKEIHLRAPTQYASYYSIFFWRINDQQALFWPRVINIKSGQNLVSDPVGSTSRLRACPFLET